MALLRLVLLILALICFLFAAIDITWRRGNLIGAGLFFYVLAMVITTGG